MGLVQAMENIEINKKSIEEESLKAEGASSDEILECKKRISLLKKEMKVWGDIVQEAKSWKIELEQIKLESKVSRTNKRKNLEEMSTC